MNKWFGLVCSGITLLKMNDQMSAHFSNGRRGKERMSWFCVCCSRTFLVWLCSKMAVKRNMERCCMVPDRQRILKSPFFIFLGPFFLPFQQRKRKIEKIQSGTKEREREGDGNGIYYIDIGILTRYVSTL